MSREQNIELHARQLERTCRYFNGLQHDRCEADVEYGLLRDVSQPGMARWPCLSIAGREATTTCPKRSFPTRDEAVATATETEREVEAFLAKIKEGKVCPHCDRPIGSRKVVGRCEYVMPCGHRLGQVPLKPTQGGGK